MRGEMASRQIRKKIVGLKDESNFATQLQQIILCRIVKRMSQNIQSPLLQFSQSCDQCQQGCFSRTGRSGQQDNFSWLNLKVDVKQNLFAQLALTKGKVDSFANDNTL